MESQTYTAWLVLIYEQLQILEILASTEFARLGCCNLDLRASLGIAASTSCTTCNFKCAESRKSNFVVSFE